MLAVAKVSRPLFAAAIATMWDVRITLTFALVPMLGLAGIWVAILIEPCARGALFLIRLKRGK